jgi:pimeloyl-ACP methyl ester carboxylesterase
VTADEPSVTERYGPDPLHLVDLFEAAPGGMTGGGWLVILVHGGFWRARWDRTHLYPMAAALAAAGCIVALPEYRRIGDPGGGWPGSGEDVLRVLETVPALVRERWGAAAVQHTALVGHSAGGHLAVWAGAISAIGAGRGGGGGADRGRGAVAGVERIVSLAGVLDLAQAHELALSDDAAGELLGPAATIADWAGADPMLLPVPTTSTVLVHGVLDDEVPVAFSRAFAERAPRIRSIELDDAGHYELIDPSSGVWPVVLEAITG